MLASEVMPTEWLAVAMIAIVALVVASTVGRRAGEHADRQAGRRTTAQAHRRGPIGAALDLVDASVAMYALRQRLGLSTTTRVERQAEDARMAAIARAEAIRRQRLGLPPTAPPTRLLVSGPARSSLANPPIMTRGVLIGVAHRPGTLRIEVAAAALALVGVLVIVAAIWPRDDGGVLSVTGSPSGLISPAPTLTPTPRPTPPG